MPLVSHMKGVQRPFLITSEVAASYDFGGPPVAEKGPPSQIFQRLCS
jgi:hypothetical protein